MATFNTAFGALQTPQDVANRSTQPSGGIRLDRMVNQQMPSLPGQQQLQAQMQTQQRQQQPAQQQQTFAQMQQAGQARPAPMPAPVSIGMPMAQQPVLLSQLQSQLGSPNMGAIQQQEQQQRQQLLRQQALQDAVQQQRQQLQYQMDKQNQQRRQGLIQNLSPEQRAIYQQAQTLGPTIDPLAVAMGGASALEYVKRSAPDVPATEEMGLITDPSRFLAYTSLGPQTGETLPPVTLPPVKSPGEYTPPTGRVLPVFGGRVGYVDSARRGAVTETPSQVSDLTKTVGDYRKTATDAETARAGLQADIYASLETLSEPLVAPDEEDREEPPKLDPTPAVAPRPDNGEDREGDPTTEGGPRPDVDAPRSVDPIDFSKESKDLIEQLRETLGAGESETLRSTATDAESLRKAAAERAAGQGKGAATNVSIATRQGADVAGTKIFTPDPYTSTLPEGFGAPMAAPTMTPPQETPAPTAPGGVTAPQGVPGAVPMFGGSQQAQQMRDLLQQQLGQFAQAPSRFDTEAFQQMRAAQQGMLEREFGAQRSQLEEELARRGLSASTIGAGRFGDLAGQQALAQAQIDAQLLQEAARTQAEDRASLLSQMSQLAQTAGQQDLSKYEAQLAGQQQQFAQGLQSAELTGAFGGAQTLEAQRLAEERRQFDIRQQLEQTLGVGELGIGQRQLDLRAEEIKQQAEQAGRSLNIEEARVKAQQEQFVKNLDEQRAQRLQNLDISQQQLNQEAQRIQQAEKGLSLEEARDQAEIGFRAQQLMQQDRTLSLNEAQFIVGAELERDKYNAQREQFSQTLDEETRRFEQSLEEQKAQRLQNFNISQTQLDQEAYKLQQQDRTLDLSEARDRAEVGIRAQQLMQQDRSLDLQEARERAQEEISIASLAEETAARLERDKISRDELDVRAQQIKYDFALRGEEIDDRRIIAEAEFQLQRERLANDYEMQGRDITSRKEIAKLDREAQEYIADQREETNRARIDMEKNQFSKDIELRRAEAQANLELSRVRILTELASLLGVEDAPTLPRYKGDGEPGE